MWIKVDKKGNTATRSILFDKLQLVCLMYELICFKSFYIWSFEISTQEKNSFDSQ